MPGSGRRQPAPFAVLAGLSFACVATAQVVTVGPAGSGAMYQEIQDGIDAAPPGGTVMVAAGQYVDSRTLTVDKPLTLLGSASGATSYVAVMSGLAAPQLPLHVTGLQPGQQVVVAGLNLVAQMQASTHAVAVVVENCAGSVVLAGVSGGGTAATASSAGVVQIRDSAMVTLDGCQFTAHAAQGMSSPPALRVERSYVHVNRSHLTGASASYVFFNQASHDGAPGVLAIDATVRLSQCRVSGGRGTQVTLGSTPAVATRGGDAITASGSLVLVRGGDNNELRGGQGGVAVPGGGPTSGPGGAALRLDGNSLGAATPDAVGTPGLDGDLQANTPAVAGPGLFVMLPTPLATAAATPTLTSPGGTFVVQLGGEPTAVVAPFAAFAQMTPVAVPGLHGVVTLDAASLMPLPFAVLDAGGRAAVAIPVPPLPAIAGTTLHVQSVAFAPSGWVSVSGPTSAAVR